MVLNREFVPTQVPKTDKYEKRLEASENKSSKTFFDTFEGYFDQRSHSLKYTTKLSKNTMSMGPSVSKDEFAMFTNVFNKHYLKEPRAKLQALQRKMFPQYWFEITQGFSLLFYGIGSKRNFLEDLAIKYISPKLTFGKRIALQKELELKKVNKSTGSIQGIPCLIINGYNPTCSYREIFQDITDIMFPDGLTRNETKFWGNLAILQVQKMIEFYSTQPKDIKLILVIHNLDGPALRKEIFQTIFSSLAQIKQIVLIASVDHIYAPVLFDNKKAQNYNFVFHDVTNYESNEVESSFQDKMNLGKSSSSSGAEGAKYVLESLTLNAKKMYKLLLDLQLNNMDLASGSKNKSASSVSKRGGLSTGVEFKSFVTMCASEFIASNEISLRTMLTEFIEHKMLLLSRHSSGTEYLYVPYRYSEMEKILSTVLNNIE